MTELKDKNELVDFAVTARKYKTLLTEKYKKRVPWEAPNEKEVRSHIPGTIVKVCVKQGDCVKKGELMLIHEAMKMQNRVEMPYDGVIAKICVTEGERIPKDHIMVEIE